jgi:hypothetical protein
MNTPRRLSISISLGLGLVLAAACGKPVDPSGKPDQSFGQAGMGGPELPVATPTPPSPGGRPLAADVSIEVVSWLVSFNRLQTAKALEDALNRKPGQFSKVDSDADGVLDYIAVVEKPNPDGHAFELRTRAQPGQATPEVVVATMMFDKEWGFAGHYDGAVGGVAAVAAAAPAAVPAAAAPAIAAAPSAPAPAVAVAAAPATTPTPSPSVQAVPAGSDVEAGVAAKP